MPTQTSLYDRNIMKKLEKINKVKTDKKNEAKID